MVNSDWRWSTTADRFEACQDHDRRTAMRSLAACKYDSVAVSENVIKQMWVQPYGVDHSPVRVMTQRWSERARSLSDVEPS